MRNLFLGFIASLIVLLTACGGDHESSTTEENDVNNETVSGCLDFAIAEKYGSLDPIHVTDVGSFHIASQIFEPLLRIDDKDLTLQPLLAKSWEASEDNLTHTFNLKKGVFFHDNACFDGGKGRELKASDVVYTFERIYSGENYAYSMFMDKIVGGEEFRNGGESISGIKVIDDYTVEFTLTKPSSNFLNLLATVATAIVAKEAVEQNVTVGSGPFTYSKENDTETAITLNKNSNYHMKDKNGEALPYLNCVAFNYVKDGQEQLDLFMNKKLDIITSLPSKAIKEIVETQIADFQDKPVKYVLGRYPINATNYLSLNTAIEPFNNVKVRQAISMAINKDRIVDDVLKGEAAGPGNHGIAGTAINNYDYSSVVGHSFDVAKAKKLLAEAGYPNGKGFPTLIFATGKGNIAVRVALEIQKQLLANLNINVELSSMSFVERKAANAASECHMSFDGWLAEFPDPIAYLAIAYGGNVPESTTESSFPNESRFKNSQFDKLYEEALVTIDEKKRFELCLQADQIIATEVPCIPLWYHEDYHLIQSSVNGYSPNAMNTQYLTYVKLVEPKVETKEAE